MGTRTPPPFPATAYYTRQSRIRMSWFHTRICGIIHLHGFNSKLFYLLFTSRCMIAHLLSYVKTMRSRLLAQFYGLFQLLSSTPFAIVRKKSSYTIGSVCDRTCIRFPQDPLPKENWSDVPGSHDCTGRVRQGQAFGIARKSVY